MPYLCHCLPDFAGVRCELTNSNSSADDSGCTHQHSCGQGRKLPTKPTAPEVNASGSIHSKDDSVAVSADGMSTKNETTYLNVIVSTGLPHPSHGRASQSTVTITSSERNAEPTKTATEVKDDDDDIAMRWIMLSVGLGVGMAVLMSAMLLFAAVCWRRWRQRKRSQKASSSIMHNVRNDVTASVHGRREDVKSTKINNIIDASKIAAIDVKTPSTALTGGDAMLPRCNVKYAESDNQIPLSHKNIVVTRDCRCNHVVSNNFRNEASMLAQTCNNGSQRKQHRQQLHTNFSRMDARCEDPTADPSPSPPPSPPLLILERLQLPQQQQQLQHIPAIVHLISEESPRKGAKFLSIHAVDDDQECHNSRCRQSNRIESGHETGVV